MVEPSLMVRYVHGSITHGGPIGLFLFQPMLHYWCKKGRNISYPACVTVYIKDPFSRYMNDSLPYYVLRNITVNKMC